MHYVILSFNSTTGKATVEFPPYLAVSIDIPIENNAFLSGDALHAFILGFSPSYELERGAALANLPVVPIQLQAALESVRTPTYVELRANSYPSMSDFIDGMVKADSTQMQDYVDRCLAVKAMYPKPNAVEVSQEVLQARRDL